MEDNNLIDEESKKDEGNSTSGSEDCNEDVKSRAVVVYSSVTCPVLYSQLKCNTDIKQPPANWLTSSTKLYGLHHGLYKSNEFTSFLMAHMFPDCLGEVDVVSDAENIKKLLKIPYNKAPVSMMIHRIENTLLIDEFDIHKHLILTAESDWKWMRKFFYENIINSLCKGKAVGVGQGWLSRSLLQQKSLLSKFLHYSFTNKRSVGKFTDDTSASDSSSSDGINIKRSHCTTSPEAVPMPPPPQNILQVFGSANNDQGAVAVETATGQNSTSINSSNESSGPLANNTALLLPDPELSETIPGQLTNDDYRFIRNVAWTFEDIRMLLGTDMPIFGGGTHPCISLRLRDIEKPISVLTGIDYWLDNLMSNVPEVVMCYHLDGIVKKYELIKTEDLPHLSESKFSPKLIRDVAQNILSFLKTNATKAGHTYWLFKARNDDVVKLYDLTSLCSDCLMEKEENPFTVPVGLLLYRVARNMKQSQDKSNLQPGTIRMLLENCLSLLPIEKYPQIVMSAHYMLSDLYLPRDTNPWCPLLEDEVIHDPDDSDDVDDQQHQAHNSSMASTLDSAKISAATEVQVESLCVGWEGRGYPGGTTRQKSPPPLTGTVVDRCKSALIHVSKGLQCLEYFESCETDNDIHCKSQSENKWSGFGSFSGQKKSKEDDELKMAKPSQPIPMPYSSLDNSSSVVTCDIDKKLNNEFVTTAVTGCLASSADDNINQDDETASATGPTEEDSVINDGSGCKDGSAPYWRNYLHVILLEKAALSFACLQNHYMISGQHGISLGCARYYISVVERTILCQTNAGSGSVESGGSGSGSISGKRTLCGEVLKHAGDSYLSIAKLMEKNDSSSASHWNDLAASHKILPKVPLIFPSDSYKDSEESTSDDNCGDACLPGDWSRILPLSYDDINSSLVNSEWSPSYKVVMISKQCYSRAMQYIPNDTDLIKRMANLQNEISTLLLNSACRLRAEASQDTDNEDDCSDQKLAEIEEKTKNLIEKAESELKEGINMFEKINDINNLALLYSNAGRIMRVAAHFLFHSPYYPENKFHVRSEEYYLKGLKILGSRKDHPQVWDIIHWELSSAMFNLASHWQQSEIPPHKTVEEVSKDVVDLYTKALKYCDLVTPSSKLVHYQFRAAKIHQKLASLFHKQYRRSSSCGDSVSDNKRRCVLKLAQNHYCKSADLLSAIECCPVESLIVLAERAYLYYNLALETNSTRNKLKHLETCLTLFAEQRMMFADLADSHSEDTLSAVSSVNSSSPKSPSSESSRTECEKDSKICPSSKSNDVETVKKDEHVSRSESSCSSKEEPPAVEEEEEEEEKTLIVLNRLLCDIFKVVVKMSENSRNKSNKDDDVSHYKEAYSLLLKGSIPKPSSAVFVKVIDKFPCRFHVKSNQKNLLS